MKAKKELARLSCGDNSDSTYMVELHAILHPRYNILIAPQCATVLSGPPVVNSQEDGACPWACGAVAVPLSWSCLHLFHYISSLQNNSEALRRQVL